MREPWRESCISFDSYIKPQLSDGGAKEIFVVYLLIPTSNHNSVKPRPATIWVVYLLIPTSNHNFCWSFFTSAIVVYLLIPTSNHNAGHALISAYVLYIFWFLHQTTTGDSKSPWPLCCISFDSYIKPQLGMIIFGCCMVVYLLIPTSNHNPVASDLWRYKLYIFWFLHQTTTVNSRLMMPLSCISFDSYIKPQLEELTRSSAIVVYLLIPTSNHNVWWALRGQSAVVYLLIPTSNHNLVEVNSLKPLVVYLLIPTSNHNLTALLSSL